MAKGVQTDVEVFEVEVGGETLVVVSMPAGHAASDARLTAAEREILTDLTHGLSNAEIGARRGRAVRTVANQVASIFRKYGVNSRAELMALLVRPR